MGEYDPYSQSYCQTIQDNGLIMAQGRGKQTRLLKIKNKNICKRFWSFVKIGKKDECWLWTGSINNCGHGRFKVTTNLQMPAHRVAWILYNKKEIRPKMVIRHTCNTEACCNPFHLIKGTQRQNIIDQYYANTHHTERNELGQFTPATDEMGRTKDDPDYGIPF
jgi:hypothetical protein